VAAAARTSIRLLKASAAERQAQQWAVRATKEALVAAGLPVMPTDTHIVPVMVRDADLCKQASDLLLADHSIYIQPINYPTVARGEERLRITPTPFHDATLIAQLVTALSDVWQRLGLPRSIEPAEREAGVASRLVVTPAGG
jgi:5-aminolevulinate synthase